MYKNTTAILNDLTAVNAGIHRFEITSVLDDSDFVTEGVEFLEE